MPDSDDEVPKKGAKAGELSAKQQRQQERATKWRDNSSTGEAAKEGDASAKVYLKPSEKKKVAYIKGEFHDTVDTVNCYLVFAHHDPSRAQGDQLSPSEAARLAVEKCDGTVLLGRTIRVDRVGSAEKGRKEGRSDPKFTIFVGNLDFSSKEEDVRAFFEGVVTTERGPVSEGDDEVTGKPKTWVRHVRIVRDANTQLGKGFAYVEFAVCLHTFLLIPFVLLHLFISERTGNL
jgi:nucleolar protein 12